MIDLYRRGAAGRSAERKYKELSRAWRRRILGGRLSKLLWVLWAAGLAVVVKLHLGSTWAFYAGFGFGAAATASLLLPDAVMPGRIFNWQMGSWGEQKTASELRRLKRDGWVVNNDVAWGARANHDHVVAGQSVYLLNSKNVPESAVMLENNRLRVALIDDPDNSYIADRWIPAVEREANSLERRLERELGFPVAVYPVIVLWAHFEQGAAYIGDVCVVEGSQLVDWIRSRPADLLSDEKRLRVGGWVKDLPRA